MMRTVPLIAAAIALWRRTARAGPLASGSPEVFFSLSALEIEGSGATGVAIKETSA